MKNKILVCGILLFLPFSFMAGQNKVKYSYDAGGNRIKKEIVMALRTAGEEDNPIFTEQFAEQTIKIYPNPTRGELKVELSDFENAKDVSLNLLNMQGQSVFKTKMKNNPADLDISAKTNGVYILQITIDGETSAWKIIKE